MFSTFSYFVASFPEFWWYCYSLLITHSSFSFSLFLSLPLSPFLFLSLPLSPLLIFTLFLSHLLILLTSFLFSHFPSLSLLSSLLLSLPVSQFLSLSHSLLLCLSPPSPLYYVIWFTMYMHEPTFAGWRKKGEETTRSGFAYFQGSVCSYQVCIKGHVAFGKLCR